MKENLFPYLETSFPLALKVAVRIGTYPQQQRVW